MEANFEQCALDSKYLNYLNSTLPKQAAAKSAE